MSLVICPYCGLNNWSMIQFLTKRGSENYVIVCRCSNCGHVFYMYKTRFFTRTFKLEDAESR
jgi:DNA-directed RNA polymerase subunit M/transcription elongation factor TFIIS